MKESITKIIIGILAGLGILYACFLFVLPPVLCSSFFRDLVDDYIYEKTGVLINSEHLNVKTYPNLTVKVSADSIKLDSDDIELMQAKNSSILFDLKSCSLKNVDIDFIYLNELALKDKLKKKDSKKSKLNFQKFPKLNVKKAEIWIDKGDINSVFININDFSQTQAEKRTIYNFEAEIISPLLKNLVTLGKEGSLYYENGTLYADNFQALVGVSSLNISGEVINKKRNNINLAVTGNDIPIEDIMSSLLYFQKIKEPGKKFIENFYNYSGIMDIDIKINKDGVFGHCIAEDLAGTSVLFDVPILFPTVDFIFDERTMKAEANGILGGEEVFANVKMYDIASPEQTVIGTVHSELTDDFADKYIPDFRIKGIADTSVSYHIKNKKINVNYFLKVPQKSDIYYKTANLGLEDKTRRLTVNTFKEADKLTITNYDYSTYEEDEINKIIMGDGLFLKENGHLTPQYLTFKTQKDAPISVTGSFYKYLDGGYFNGDLLYNFKKNKITGTFDIKDSKYKNFKLNTAKVKADENIVNIQADGLYNNSPFECNIKGVNKFSKQIKIFDMYFFLDEFIVNSNNKSLSKPSAEKVKEITDKVKKIDVDVDKWTIKLNKIKRNRMVLKDINITGSIHNNIFTFVVPHLNFAQGVISANGEYNYIKRSSDVFVSAKNIDSATVADVVFDFPGQIEGLANAYLHAITNNGDEDIKAYVKFSVDKGYLPKIGSTDFMIKKSKLIKKPFKVRLSDIISIDVQNMKALSSDLKGRFFYDNQVIKDIYITSSQKYLSFLVEGEYDTSSQQADLQVLGKYDKDKVNKVKIMFVPLSVILKTLFRKEASMQQYKEKMDAIPEIDIEGDEESYFRVKINGNLVNNNVKVEMKRIK